MGDIGNLGQEFGEYVLEVAAELLGRQQASSLSEIERNTRRALLQLGQFLLEAWLAMQAEQYPAERIPCPCGSQAEYQFKREGTLLTVVGQVSYRRAYYLCPVCHRGCYPLDDRLGLRAGQMSAELESLAGMTGVQMPFGQGSQHFEALTLIALSDHSLAKASQAIGEEVQVQEQEWMAQSRNEQWLQDQDRLAHQPERLYGTIDAAKVRIRGDQEHPWRDVKVGAWFTSLVEPPQTPEEEWEMRATDISYYCGILAAQEFGDLVWATGCQRQAQLAQELIFIADGAQWIWNLVEEYYPNAIQIVDWFHATEYIAPVANLAFANDTESQDWIDEVRTKLWNGDLEAVIQAFQRFTAHPKAGEEAQKAVTFFSNNGHRMNYPEYRAQGYHIGSGTIESGCKQIVTQRLKVAGAIWELDNAIKIVKARAALLSGQWETITARREYLSLPLAA